MSNPVSTALKPDQNEVEDNPLPAEDPLSHIIQLVSQDSRNEPLKYLESAIVPEGGE